MTPASKGNPAKRVPAPRSAATTTGAQSRAGGKTSTPRAVVEPKKPALTKKSTALTKKAVPVVKKTATPSKKAAPSAKKATTAATTVKRTSSAAGKSSGTTKKAPQTAKKTVPAGRKPQPTQVGAQAQKKATASASASKVSANNAKGAGSAASTAAATAAAAAAAPAPPRSTFTPKPKPPAPVRPKTGPYAKDAKFLDEARELLLADRAIYQEQATSLRAEADSLALEREPGDVQFDEESGEGGTVTVDRERNLALSGQASIAVEEIDDALGRIDDKTYGYCERCFQPIPKPRLRALPYARLCVACKSGGLSRR